MLNLGMFQKMYYFIIYNNIFWSRNFKYILPISNVHGEGKYS